jgi:hypothetical protein
MNKKVIVSLHHLLVVGFLALINVSAELSRQTKIINECLVVGQMAVQPSLDDSPTNSFTVYAKDGTNYWGIDPTNAAPRMGIGGTNAVGATVTIAFSGTNLVFIKGILTRAGQ